MIAEWSFRLAFAIPQRIQKQSLCQRHFLRSPNAPRVEAAVPKSVQESNAWFIVEVVFTALFGIELILRFLSCEVPGLCGES